jgi:hypothetical protein
MIIVAGGLLSIEDMLLYTETLLYEANNSRRTVVYGSYVLVYGDYVV